MSPRRPLTAALAVAALSGAAAPAGAQVPAKPPLGAALAACETGLNAAERAADFSGSMPLARGSTSMAMRFDLFEQQGGTGPFRRVAAPRFGRWERSQRNVAGFVYEKRVEGLKAPAAYRVTVRFRWYDAGGAVVRHTVRHSATCRQPDLRPDLRVTRVAVAPTADGQASYTVTVANAGATMTQSPFDTTLDVGVGGATQTARAAPGLAPGGLATLTFRGARCAVGAPLLVVTDTGGAIDEADEAGNAVRRTCPAL